MKTEPTVFVVDDDLSVLRSLRWLIESAHLLVKTFSSGESFLEDFDPSSPGCLILDIRMAGMNGLDVQQKLIEKGYKLPIIVMTGHGDVPLCTHAFKSGAFDFIEKPADDKVLINQIHAALAADAKRRESADCPSDIAARLAELTPREVEVMDLIVQGKLHKQIASDLGISFQTAAKHRTKVLMKLGVGNDVELVRLVLSMNTGSAT